MPQFASASEKELEVRRKERKNGRTYPGPNTPIRQLCSRKKTSTGSLIQLLILARLRDRWRLLFTANWYSFVCRTLSCFPIICTLLLHHPSIIHHNAPKTMRTNIFVKGDVLTNSPRRNEEINRVLRHIGQIKNEVEALFGDHQWAVIILWVLSLDFGLLTYQPLATASTLHRLLIATWRSLGLWRGVKAFTSNVGLPISLKMDVLRCSSMLTVSSFVKTLHLLSVSTSLICRYWNQNFYNLRSQRFRCAHRYLWTGWAIYDGVGGMVRSKCPHIGPTHRRLIINRGHF